MTNGYIRTLNYGENVAFESRYADHLGFWVAVAKGSNPCDEGAAYDFALGLGIGKSKREAETRAIGEVLERNGAAVGGVQHRHPEQDAINESGQKVGRVPSRDVYLPWIGPNGPDLPCSSDGLAFGTTCASAMASAKKEIIERYALKNALCRNGGILPMGSLSVGLHQVKLWRIPGHIPVALAVIVDVTGGIYAAGAGADIDWDRAKRRAVEEAALALLCRDGDILPGQFTGMETFLTHYGITEINELQSLQKTANDDPSPVEVFYAQACPNHWPRQGRWVMRAVLEDQVYG